MPRDYQEVLILQVDIILNFDKMRTIIIACVIPTSCRVMAICCWCFHVLILVCCHLPGNTCHNVVSLIPFSPYNFFHKNWCFHVLVLVCCHLPVNTCHALQPQTCVQEHNLHRKYNLFSKLICSVKHNKIWRYITHSHVIEKRRKKDDTSYLFSMW